MSCFATIHKVENFQESLLFSIRGLKHFAVLAHGPQLLSKNPETWTFKMEPESEILICTLWAIQNKRAHTSNSTECKGPNWG